MINLQIRIPPHIMISLQIRITPHIIKNLQTEIRLQAKINGEFLRSAAVRSYVQRAGAVTEPPSSSLP